jgi:hypothetical protein
MRKSPSFRRKKIPPQTASPAKLIVRGNGPAVTSPTPPAYNIFFTIAETEKMTYEFRANELEYRQTSIAV